MVTVTLFNANSLDLLVSINNGQQFTLSSASAPNWTPQQAAAGGPTWSDISPGQNVIAPGDNYLQITPTGAIQPSSTVVNLPRNFQWTSVQLYIFFNAYSDLSWIVLNNGQYVTGDLTLGGAGLRAQEPEAVEATQTAHDQTA